MARISRIVVPGHPHHVTQRGNRRQDVFFCDDDYRLYIELLKKFCSKAKTDIWGYCLMPNHVHLILVPSHEDGLRGAIAEAHRRYTRHINEREEWLGHLWQGRFASFPMDEQHLLACARYVELNPVRAGLVKRPGDWQWSSANAHLKGHDDNLVKVAPLLRRVGEWSEFLRGGMDQNSLDAIRAGERTGRPLGSERFIKKLERTTGRRLQKEKPGPKMP
ncbi:MAG: transposase [Alphaproteobacteria bacterium]|nr:MAG: transposase [Alphaproteobacteria bacterium]